MFETLQALPPLVHLRPPAQMSVPRQTAVKIPPRSTANLAFLHDLIVGLPASHNQSSPWSTALPQSTSVYSAPTPLNVPTPSGNHSTPVEITQPSKHVPLHPLSPTNLATVAAANTTKPQGRSAHTSSPSNVESSPLVRAPSLQNVSPGLAIAIPSYSAAAISFVETPCLRHSKGMSSSLQSRSLLAHHHPPSPLHQVVLPMEFTPSHPVQQQQLSPSHPQNSLGNPTPASEGADCLPCSSPSPPTVVAATAVAASGRGQGRPQKQLPNHPSSQNWQVDRTAECAGWLPTDVEKGQAYSPAVWVIAMSKISSTLSSSMLVLVPIHRKIALMYVAILCHIASP